ncbi:GH36 C-terminal domain-containing protein [Actinoallomurus acanthiterrae]
MDRRGTPRGHRPRRPVQADPPDRPARPPVPPRHPRRPHCRPVRRSGRDRGPGLATASPRRRPTVPIRLRDLDPAARYRDEDTGRIHHGAVLMAHGIDPGLRADYSSTLIRLTPER